MQVLIYFSFIIIQIIKIISGSSVAYNGYCGDPGRPVRSQLSPVQPNYKEEDTVVYTCDDYISLKQPRQCIKGNWLGLPAVCGNSFKDNDLRKAKVLNSENNNLIKEYIITNLSSFTKFGNSFIAERYDQPLRAFGAKKYRIELYMSYKSVFQLVRISLSVVNHLIDKSISSAQFNITKVTVSPYRKCVLTKQSSVSGWLHNSTRFDHWFSCQSIDDRTYQKEIKDLSDSVIIHTESNATLELDLATFILAKPYTAERDPLQPLCGTPEVPIGLDTHVIHHETKYSFKCSQGFRRLDNFGGDSHELVCGTDMKWLGRLPQCFPIKTCDKFQLSDKHSTEVYLYENVYYHNSSIWYAIEGTKAYFRCKDDIQIFIGKEVRICNKDGYWTESLPNCLVTQINQSPKVSESSLSVTAISVIVLIILIITFSLTGISIFCFFKMKKRNNNSSELAFRQSNTYADYDWTADMPKQMDTALYEDVVDPRYAGNQYQPRNPTPHAYTPMDGEYERIKQSHYDDCVQYKPDLHTQQLDDSYVTMKIT